MYPSRGAYTFIARHIFALFVQLWAGWAKPFYVRKPLHLFTRPYNKEEVVYMQSPNANLQPRLYTPTSPLIPLTSETHFLEALTPSM